VRKLSWPFEEAHKHVLSGLYHARLRRFYHLKHPETSHITAADPGTSNHSPDTFLRKSDPNFMRFQTNDLERRQRHREAVRKK
jgi:hypothetical protein